MTDLPQQQEMRLDETARDAAARYRLRVVRSDGSRLSVLGSMTLEDAQRSRDAIREAGIFLDVQIVPDDGG